MDETNKQEMEKATETTESASESENTNDGVSPNESPVDKARAVVEELKAENTRREALIAREEQLAASRMLGGESEAGQGAVEPKEDSPEEYVAKVMNGEIGNKA